MEVRQLIEDFLAEHGDTTGNPRAMLLPLLKTIQQRLGFIPAEIFTEIETRLGIPRHLSYSVASFYDDFRFDRPAEHVIRICDGAACELAGCRDLLSIISAELGIQPGEVTGDGCFRLETVNCLGHCSLCPAVRIRRFSFWPGNGVGGAVAAASRAKRRRNDAWRNCVNALPGTMSSPRPLRRSREGFWALSRVSLTEAGGMGSGRRIFNIAPIGGRTDPADLVDAVKECGLRGLGGAGFPVGKKWELATANPPPRILVCNADESEPGTFKDRFLLRHRPLLVLEGMVLAGYAIGADRGILYMRSDYARPASGYG